MSWLPILALALAVFLIAGFVLRLPRDGWALFGSALLFGLTGYALQGAPAQPGAPKDAQPLAGEGNEALVAARREFYGPDTVPSRFVTVADAYARQGRFGESAEMLRNAVKEDPEDAEAWLALGIALVEHAEGNPTPPALYAMERAQRLEPDNPAPAYFLGIAMMQGGRPDQTLAIWRELAASAPAGSPWKTELDARIERLETMMGVSAPATSTQPPAE